MDDDDEALSDHESIPPAANGHAVPAAAVNGAANANPYANPAPAPGHPLWEKAAGRGGGAKKGAGMGVSAGRFGPISMAVLEQRARHEFDGESSVGGRTAHGRSKGGAHKQRHARHDDDDDEDDEDDDRANRKKKRKDVPDYEDELDDDDAMSEAASGADVVAGAAFGGAAKKAHSCTLSVVSDTDDGASVTSSRARKAHCRAFPISGETCVGCALPAKVVVVDDFVRTNCDKMKEDALFKMAALVYQQKVVEPAEAEDVPVPSWSWKDMRSHFTMHRMDPKMQR